jgi:hypothetical protein
VADRVQLLQTALRYLNSSGVEAKLTQVRVFDRSGMGVAEAAISLKGRNINRISLSPLVCSSCSLPGNVLRFHFRVDCPKAVSRKLGAGTLAMTVRGAGGLRWTGGPLAEILNRDPEITRSLHACEKSSFEIDFRVEASPSHEINIVGPSFSNPYKFYSLFSENSPGKIDLECGFCFRMAEKIGGRIKQNL